jgi:putative ABC transport system permease protein
MNAFLLAWRYLRARPLVTLFNVALLALSVATAGFVAIVDRQLGESLYRDIRGIDLVVGAKGSPIQLLLSGIYHVDVPTGNIPATAAAEFAANPLIRKVIPLSLGDSFRGFRIVGTTPDYLALYGGAIAEGRMWNGTMQAVLGTTAAARTRLGAGDRFIGSHGLSEGGSLHGDAEYEVVGILAPTSTVLDRLIVVNTESVWFVHEGPAHDDEEKRAFEEARQHTVLLVQYASPVAAASLPRKINEDTALQAASPAYESARLFRMIGVGVEVIRAFSGVLFAVAALSLFVALYHALNERAYDIAVLRTLGRSRAGIAGMLLAEALMLAALGAITGLALAHVLAALLATRMTDEGSLQLAAWAFSIDDLRLLVPAFAAAVLAALFPVWRAANADISATLARRM